MNENFQASKVHRLAHIGMLFGIYSNTCFEICSTSMTCLDMYVIEMLITCY